VQRFDGLRESFVHFHPHPDAILFKMVGSGQQCTENRINDSQGIQTMRE
jgi:hypothetical protein